jgi:hypothetical protein
LLAISMKTLLLLLKSKGLFFLMNWCLTQGLIFVMQVFLVLILPWYILIKHCEKVGKYFMWQYNTISILSLILYSLSHKIFP